MSGRMMNDFSRNIKVVSIAFLILSLAACNPLAGGNNDYTSDEPPLAGAAIGGSFTLTNEDGGQTSGEDFAGQYRIMYFGFSYCPDVCPTDLTKLMMGLKKAEADNPDLAAKIQPIFITLDPERDSPEIVKQYTANFHPRLLGLTGSQDEIDAVAKKFLIIHEKREVEGASEYLIDHSRQAYLFGPEGEPLALLPYDGTPDEVASEILKWVS